MGGASRGHRAVARERQERDLTFVDTNVFMYAVGRPHPLQAEARAGFLASAPGSESPLCTSAEVLQELLHAYLPVGRLDTLDAALKLVEGRISMVWPIASEDVRLARSLVTRHPSLGARDLLHLASAIRREALAMKTFDRPLLAAFGEHR